MLVFGVMEPTEVTIEILRRIQAELAGLRSIKDEIAGLRSDTNARFETLERHASETNRSLAKLHGDMVTTNETLGLIHHRLQFAEAAAGAATNARSRLDDRVEALDAEVGRLRERLDAIERDD
jgi:chromosome segregation ATPase